MTIFFYTPRTGSCPRYIRDGFEGFQVQKMEPKYKDVETIPKNDADPLRLSEGEPLWRNAVSLAL